MSTAKSSKITIDELRAQGNALTQELAVATERTAAVTRQVAAFDEKRQQLQVIRDNHASRAVHGRNDVARCKAIRDQALADSSVYFGRGGEDAFRAFKNAVLAVRDYELMHEHGLAQLAAIDAAVEQAEKELQAFMEGDAVKASSDHMAVQQKNLEEARQRFEEHKARMFAA